MSLLKNINLTLKAKDNEVLMTHYSDNNKLKLIIALFALCFSIAFSSTIYAVIANSLAAYIILAYALSVYDSYLTVRNLVKVKAVHSVNNILGTKTTHRHNRFPY